MDLGKVMKTSFAMSAFQASCLDNAMQVLNRHGIEGSTPREVHGDFAYILVEFRHRDQLFQIEIYENDVYMHQGKGLFECYLKEENVSATSLVEGFSRRLDRYLSNGKWDEDR